MERRDEIAEIGTKRSKETNGHQTDILVIWGDDIGISNLSCYSQGLMGYKTPNIDRLAKEGMLFTDSYGEQSVPLDDRRSSPARASCERGCPRSESPQRRSV